MVKPLAQIAFCHFFAGCLTDPAELGASSSGGSASSSGGSTSSSATTADTTSGAGSSSSTGGGTHSILFARAFGDTTPSEKQVFDIALADDCSAYVSEAGTARSISAAAR